MRGEARQAGRILKETASFYSSANVAASETPSTICLVHATRPPHPSSLSHQESEEEEGNSMTAIEGTSSDVSWDVWIFIFYIYIWKKSHIV